MAFYITQFNSEAFLYKQHVWKIYRKIKIKFISKYLIKSFRYVETMLMLYSRVFMVRFDLSPSNFNHNNNHIKIYLNGLVNDLSEYYQCKCSYICAREQKLSHLEHYHVVLFLSAHKIQYPNCLFKRIKRSWRCFDGGSTHRPKNPYYMLKRGQKHTLEKAIYRLSYLSKTNTKELTPKGVSSVIFSRLSIPEEISHGTNDILLVDARYNPPLSKITVTPLLYSDCKAYSKVGRAKTFKKHHALLSGVAKSILNSHKLPTNNKQINPHAHQVDHLSVLYEPKIDPV